MNIPKDQNPTHYASLDGLPEEHLRELCEKLITRNAGLQEKVEELSRAKDGLEKLLADTVATAASDRDRLEKALREKTERLQLFIEHAPVALAMFDTDMRYLKVSRRWQSDYGLAELDLIGKCHYDVFPENSQRWREAHRHGLAGEVLRAETDCFKRADGSVQWILWEIWPWHDAAGGIGGIVIFTEDITERKRAEAALRDSERLYRAIGETIDYGVWVCAPDGHNTYASESFLKLVGMTQERCSNFGWGDVLHPDDADSTIAAWKECVRTEGVWDIEHRFRGADGQWHPVLARGVPVRDDRGELLCWAGINLDISRMKRVENELRASEEKFSTMFNALPIAIALSALPDGALFDVNPAWLDLSGFARKEEVIGRTSLELGLIEDPVQREWIINKFRQNGCARDVELTFRTRQGVERTVLVNLDRVEIGGRCFILSTMEEITELKRTEEALRESEGLYRLLFSNMNEAFFLAQILCDDEGKPYDYRYLDINPVFEANTGKTREQVVGKRALEVFPNSNPSTIQIYGRVALEGVAAHFEVFRESIGRHFDILGFPVGHGRFGALFMDITERKLAEADLQRANDDLERIVKERTQDLVIALDKLSGEMAKRQKTEDLLRLNRELLMNIIDLQTECICRFDSSGVLTFVNRAYCRFFGKSSQELVGSMWHPRAYLDDIPHIEERLKAMSQAKPSVVIENRVFNAGGELRWMQFINRGVFDEKGVVIETQVVGRDITERKQAEEDLRQALEAANAANNTMNRLLRIIAHEFRTPLGLLTGCTDILDRYWSRLTPEQRLEQNRHIRNAARQIANLVNSVTTYQESGKDDSSTPSRLPDVGDFCRTIVEEVKTVWCDGHEFCLSIAGDCGAALLNDTLFRQILQNLLSNAFRYTPSSGSVSFSLCRARDMLLMEIADTGIGIPEKDQKLIFDAFYRSRNVEERRGLGLGLFIVKEALAMMGGAITIASSQGEGTTVRVEIPAHGCIR